MTDLSHAYQLRSRLRRIAENDRVRSCGRRAITPQPALVVSVDKNGQRRAWWEGILRCGRQHSCPVCGAKRAAERLAEFERMKRADDGGSMIIELPGKKGTRTVALHGGEWRMVTLTLRHHAAQDLNALIADLFTAWRAVRATRVVRDIFALRVTASVRALEVTWSDRNGWHPHIHLVLRTKDWTDDEKETLEREWLRAVPGQKGIAVVWSNTPAKYLSKLGAEVAGVGKVAKDGHHNAWQLARAALERPELVPLWREYQRAMHGKRILEFDERAKAIAARAPEVDEVSQRFECTLFAEEYNALARHETHDDSLLWLAIEVVTHTAGPDPPAHFRAWLDDVLQGTAYARAA